MKKGKILFTGGGGFMGRQLVPLLRRDGWEVVSPRSTKVNLENKDEVLELFRSELEDITDQPEHFDAIIHGAMVGKKFAGKNVIDDKEIVYTNLRMLENLLDHLDKTDMFINFDSGISDKIVHIKEEDPYAFAKYCIAQRVLNLEKGVNLKSWGCFGPYEDPERFFHTNINNYLQGKDIVIHKDKKMDFIYVNDFYKILCYYLQNIKIAFPKEVECVYEKKYYLTEIAEIINNMGEHKVNIVKNEDGIDDPYCGTSNNLLLKYEGLEKGIRDCYLYYMKVQNRQIDRKYSSHIWK